ncbi:20230_t:CDS:2, partial [Dentiscutata erythropus]
MGGYYPLLIIEWNEAELAQQNVQKNTVLTYIRTFPGCNDFPGGGQPQSSSLFYIVGTRGVLGVPAQQTMFNIIHGLQRIYALRDVPSLGR